MRAVIGAVALLIALAVVGLLMARSLRDVGRLSVPQASLGAAPASGASDAAPRGPRDVERQVANDVAEALRRGVESRGERTEAP